MKNKIKYPNIPGNHLCDGKIHSIKINRMFRIDNYNLFVLEYYDFDHRCNVNTILTIIDGKYYKVPLSNYDEYYNLINNGGFILHPIELRKIDIPNTLARLKLPPIPPVIYNVKPVKDIYRCLTIARALIILYIDSEGNIYTILDGKRNLINSTDLLNIMEEYDIEWRELETNTLASKERINTALNIYNPRIPGLSFEGRGAYDRKGAMHYTVSNDIEIEQGVHRIHSSI